MIRVQVVDEPVRTRSRSAVVVPGSTSQLINDSGFQTAAQVAAAIAGAIPDGVLLTDVDNVVRYKVQFKLAGGKPVIAYDEVQGGTTNE